MTRSLTMRSRAWRRWFVGAGVAVMLLAAGAVATWWAARTYGPALTRERLEVALAQAAGAPARIEAVQLEPWRGRLVVTGMAIAAGTTWDAGTLLSARRAEVRVGISSLWRREIALSRVVIEDAVLDYTESAVAGPLRLPDRFPDRLAIGPVTVAIGPVDLVRARLLYRAPVSGLALEVGDLAATLSVEGGALAATMTASRAAVRAAGLDERVERIAVAARLDGPRLNIERFGARWLSAEIRGTGRVSDLDGTPVIEARLDGTLPLRPMLARAGIGWPLEADARIDATLTGTLGSPTVSAQVTTPTLTAGRLQARRVSGRLGWRDGQIVLDAVEADALGGHVSGGVTVGTTDPVRLTLKVRGTGLYIESLAPVLADLAGPALPIPAGVAGPISVEGEYEGAAGDLAGGRASVTLDAPRVMLPAEMAALGPVAVSGEATLAGRAIEVRRVRLRAPAGEMDASGRVALDGGLAATATISADAGRLATALGTPAADGAVIVRLHARGPLARPVIAGEARTERLTARAVTVERVMIPFRAEGLGLEVVRAAATIGEARVWLGGDARWLGPLDHGRWRQALTFRATVDVESLPAEELARLAAPGRAVQGRLSGSLRAEGTAETWRASGRVSSPRLVLDGHPVTDVRAEILAHPTGIELTSAALGVHGVPVSGSGRWQWDGTGSGRVDLGPARLDGLDIIPARLAITGVVRGSAEIEMRGGAATISTTMRGDGVTVAGMRLGEARLQARLRDRDLEADLSLPEPGLAVVAAGRLAPGGTIVARLRAHDVDVTGLAGQHLPPWASGVVGRLSAVGELTVPFDRPVAAEGVLRIELPPLTVSGEEWRVRGPVVVRRRPGVTMVERVEAESRLGTLTASASVRDDGSVEGSIQGRLPLAMVPTLRPEIREAAGIVELSARLAGTVADPRIVADGTIHDGRVVLRDYPDSIRNIRARFSVSPGGLTLSEASASMGGGEVTARGDLTLEQRAVRSSRFVVAARRVALTTVADLQTVWDADLEIATVGPRAVLRGEARLVRGLYSRDISLLKTLLERQAPPAGPAAGGITLDVRCVLPDNLVVRTNLARFRARGTLTLQGTTAAPAVFGTVEGHDGEIMFRTQKFRIVSALARFDDPRRIDPIVDVRSVARIRDHEVRLSVRGRAADLEIRFASSPALPEEDVLALVAFGKTRAELARGGGEAALGEAAGYLVAELLGVDTGQLGLDVLGVETTPERGRRVGTREDPGRDLRAGTREDPGRELRVGKRIAPGTTVVYAQGLEDWSRQALRIEYEVVGPLIVAGEQDFRRGFGGDVLLRLRFR